MAEKIVGDTRSAIIEAIGPLTMTTSDIILTVSGSNIDQRPWESICYTIIASAADALWQVFASNDDDFSDEVAITSITTVPVGTAAAYTDDVAPYSYYRVKTKTADTTPSVITLYGVAKGG